MIAKGNQNIFDFVLQAFGTFENLFDDVLLPNSLAVDAEVQTNQEININAVGKGDDDVKMKISEQGLSMTNGDIPIIIEYRNGVITNSFFGEIAVLDFEAKINKNTPVIFTINWGAEVGVTILNSTLVNGVWKALQSTILIPGGVDPNQTILVADNFGGSFELGYLIKEPIPTLGLMGEWKMNNTPNDSSGNGHNGTLKGTTTPQPTTNRHEEANSAYDFNGSTAYIALEGTFPDIGSIDFSVSVWAYFNDIADDGSIVSFKESFGVGFSMTQDLSHSNAIDFRLNSVVGQLNQVTAINTWYHIVYTVDRDGNLNTYIDSVFDKAFDISSSGTFTLTVDPAFGVRNDFVLGNLLNGKIDDIRIYNRILTQTEINALFAE